MRCHKLEGNIRGKNTCDAPEIAAAMSLQIHRRSEELHVSKIAGLPYERNARTNEQRTSNIKAMSVPMLGREQAQVKERSLSIYSRRGVT